MPQYAQERRPRGAAFGCRCGDGLVQCVGRDAQLCGQSCDVVGLVKDILAIAAVVIEVGIGDPRCGGDNVGPGNEPLRNGPIEDDIGNLFRLVRYRMGGLVQLIAETPPLAVDEDGAGFEQVFGWP